MNTLGTIRILIAVGIFALAGRAEALPAQDVFRPFGPDQLAPAFLLAGGTASDTSPTVEFTRRPSGEATEEPVLVESVPGYRSEGYGVLLAAELSAPATRYSAPSPQGTSAPRKRMRGWVKAAIVVGSTIAGVALFRAVIGPDEDLAPLPGQ